MRPHRCLRHPRRHRRRYPVQCRNRHRRHPTPRRIRRCQIHRRRLHYPRFLRLRIELRW
jgi:hypothetical protein